MVGPASPVAAVLLLTFCRVGDDEVGKLPSPLVAEVDICDRDPAAGANVFIVEDDRGEETADQESVQHVAFEKPPFREISPPLGVLELDGDLNLGNSPVLVHTLGRGFTLAGNSHGKG